MVNDFVPIRVALVDDHSIVRRGLSAVLSTSDQLELVGEAEDGKESIELCERIQPDVVLMDLIMPGMDGIEATRTIHERWPEIQVLVLTSFTEQEMIQGALDAGARGYLLKNVKGRELVEAIIQVHQGSQTIAQEARQTLHLSEQLSALEEQLNQDLISTASITEALNNHLPDLFPSYQIQVRLFPNQDLFNTQSGNKAPIPDPGWEWLVTSTQQKIVIQGGELPWGGIQTRGQVLLLTPIQGKDPGRAIGGIGLLSGDVAPDIDDLTKINSSLAEILDSALEKMRIRNLRVSNDQSSDELQMAGKPQSRILPENPPEIEGWEIASCLVPAQETAGDFYDFIPLANDKWGILIADVTDKGHGAAVFMAMCSALIRTFAVRFPSLPALALSSVNERIFSEMRGGLTLTAFYGILDPKTGDMRYVNAGHNPPMLFGEEKGKPIDKLKQTGTALGVSEESTWQQQTTSFSPGDVLVMYTDGITEAHNSGGDFFDESRLQTVIHNHREHPVDEILDSILEEVNSFTSGAPDQGDWAVVVLSRKH